MFSASVRNKMNELGAEVRAISEKLLTDGFSSDEKATLLRSDITEDERAELERLYKRAAKLLKNDSFSNASRLYSDASEKKLV